MKLISFIITCVISTLCTFMSVLSYINGSIEDAKLFAIWDICILVLGIFNKEENGEENKD